MENLFFALLITMFVCSTGLLSANQDLVLTQTVLEYADKPLEAPVELSVRVPLGATSIRLVYEQLSFDGIHVLQTSSLDRDVRFVIPAEHTTQPGIRYWWEIDYNGGTKTTGEAIIPFIEINDFDIQNIGELIAHDMQRNNGKLPDGTYVSPGQGRLPHNLSPSQAPVSSKKLEVRNIVGSYIHKQVDFAMTGGNNVIAMQDGTVHFSGWDNKGGHTIILRHESGKYYTVYFHLQQRLVQYNQTVTKGQIIGKSGNTGSGAGGAYHLCTGYRIYVGGKAVSLYPFRYFMDSLGAYGSAEFDYVQVPVNGFDSILGSFTNVNVYGKGSGTPRVSIVYRQKGTTTWYESTMYQISGTNNWQFVWTGWADKTMEYYIKAGKSTTSTSHWMTRPVKYHSGNPGIYYEIKVKQGQLMSYEE